jgi:hypothetical protein
MPQNAIVGDHSKTKYMPLKLAKEHWLKEIYTTGVSDIVQLLITHFDKRNAYLITWNLAENTEHSMYQTKFKRENFVENMVMKSLGSRRNQNFNLFLEEQALINLESNVPCQYIDKFNQVKRPLGIL